MFKENHPSFLLTRDGTRLFYSSNFDPKTNPKKPLIVFNYGLVCNNAHYEAQIPFFDNLGYEILIHNYRGHYTSSGEENIEAITFKNMALDLLEIIKRVNRKKAILIGHSMGVNISLEFAKLFPDYTQMLVLISGTVLPPQNVMFNTNVVQILFPYVEAFSDKFPDLYKKIWENSYQNPIVRKIVHQGGFNTTKVSEEFVHTYLKRVGELHPKIFIKLFSEMESHDIINYLEKIETPTLVMGGDKDKVIPNHLQEILVSHLPNSEFYIVKDGSHVPQRDFPELVNKKIESFIARNTY